MTAMAAQRLLGMDDIVAEGRARCEQGERISEVAADLAARGLQPEVARLLIAFGIGRVLASQLEQRRDAVGRIHAEWPDDKAAVSRAPSVRPPAANNPHAAKLLRIYATPDGARRSLATFTIADWRSLRAQAAGAARGWRQLVDAADIAIEALERTHKTNTAELSKEVRKAIAEALP